MGIWDLNLQMMISIGNCWGFQQYLRKQAAYVKIIRRKRPAKDSELLCINGYLLD